MRSLLRLAPAHATLPADTGSFDAADDNAPLGLRVLVAEDNAINQRVLREMLDRLGCISVFAHDGAEAVLALREREFDLVLMDCQMPTMDGFAATRAIRDLECASSLVPIIALTANVLPADRRACAEAGMNDFLSKPIKKNQLRNVMLQWAGEPKTPAE